jgi:SAM-dependent methyltransferase
MLTEIDYAEILSRARLALAGGSTNAHTFGQLTDIITRGRVQLLTKLLLAKGGAVIRHGPFSGMRFHNLSSEGCYIPKLLGCYEAELHPVISALSDDSTLTIIDIGCAEGYYAVGLARRLPSVHVVACDISAEARRMTAQLAADNQVADRITLLGEIDHSTLNALIGERTLLFCDCEGCEFTLLDPSAVPALARADMVVELHGNQANPQRIKAWLERMAVSHEVSVITPVGRNPADISEIAGWKHLDQWLAVWEFRGETTPWAWLRPRKQT